jgi:hypothetical protein
MVSVTSSLRAEGEKSDSKSTSSKSDASSEKTRSEAEKHRKQAEERAEQAIDKDAAAVIQETRNAVKALSSDQASDAVAAIERATGKVDVLLARHPKAGLIPVSYEIEAIEGAPTDIAAIRERAKSAKSAVNNNDFPSARLLLEGLRSEVRDRTYNLPLATYPAALKKAAGLLEEKKTKEAQAVLSAALKTQVVIDRVTPLPIVEAEDSIAQAKAQAEKDKPLAQQHLAWAKHQLERAKELGYASQEPEYDSLNKSITELEKQLKGNGETASGFTKLENEVASFFKRISGSMYR